MASASVKEIFKTLHSIFANTTFSNADIRLPPETEQAVNAFLDKYSGTNEQDCQHLNDELSILYQECVVTDQSEKKLGPFLRLLVKLIPALRLDNLLEIWWHTAVEPIFEDGKIHWKSAVVNADQFVLQLLSNGSQPNLGSQVLDRSAYFMPIILDLYCKHTSESFNTIDNDDRHRPNGVGRERIESVLIRYGSNEPEQLLSAIDKLLLRSNTRPQALILLSTFIKSKQEGLDTVLKTHLVEHLLKCLMIDTYATVISLALSCLIMLLPHIPSSVIKHMPRLFLIYSRLLGWERFRPEINEDEKPQTVAEDTREDDEDGADPEDEPRDEETWEKLDATLDSAESVGPSEILHYFTFLYGLYPLNFTSYLRKPRKYLKSVNFPGARNFDLDQTVIKARTEKYQTLHLLHPNFYTTTIEDELTGSRWSRSEPTDVVAECMRLCIADPFIEGSWDEDTPMEKPPSRGRASNLNENPENREPPNPAQAPHISLQKQIFSTRSESRAASMQTTTESTTSLTNLDLLDLSHKSPSTAALSSPRGIEQSPSLIASGHPQSFFKGFHISQQRRTSVASFHSSGEKSQQSQLPDVEPSVSHTNTLFKLPSSELPISQPYTIETLQKENVRLRTQLSIETNFRKHYSDHFRAMNSRHLKETRVEQETQNLINSNKSLKSKLTRAHEAYVTLSNETAVSRTQSKKWEKELTSRIKRLKEDEREWKKRETFLESTIGILEQKAERLKEGWTAKDVRINQLQSENLSMTEEAAKAPCLEKKVQELETAMRGADIQALELQRLQTETEQLRTKLELTEKRLETVERSSSQSAEEHQKKLRQLNDHAAEMQKDPTLGFEPGEIHPRIKSLIDAAVQHKERTINFLRQQIAKQKQAFAELERGQAAIRQRSRELDGQHLELPFSQPHGVNGDNGSTPRSLAWAMGTSIRSDTPMSASEDEGESTADGSLANGVAGTSRPPLALRLGAYHPSTFRPSTGNSISQESASGDFLMPLGTPLSGGTGSAPITPGLTGVSGGVPLEPTLTFHAPRFTPQPQSPRLRSSLGLPAGESPAESRISNLASTLYANSNNALSGSSIDSLDEGSIDSRKKSSSSGSGRRHRSQARSASGRRTGQQRSAGDHGGTSNQNEDTDDSSARTPSQKPTPKSGSFRGMRGIM